ncbi:hypothetical protein G7K_6288-t1 [Saitoella complicata NRRL Y-17804]|uniref:Uncharacterized protein n=1 Tax=Saitoella complicata (strain BCRC 22490 / CBS 7301 / JCM 7358 / NBRC 10748 / NRRL Y-17804) TaxID=698492 RepID=A0A0E9NRZ5_SAICN|nr:hypothetical protein G7K_6288-t1 [Saitoella complicata NRRL Y-17804]
MLTTVEKTGFRFIAVRRHLISRSVTDREEGGGGGESRILRRTRTTHLHQASNVYFFISLVCICLPLRRTIPTCATPLLSKPDSVIVTTRFWRMR